MEKLNSKNDPAEAQDATVLSSMCNIFTTDCMLADAIKL
jgi:hypothetical protein